MPRILPVEEEDVEGLGLEDRLARDLKEIDAAEAALSALYKRDGEEGDE